MNKIIFLTALLLMPNLIYSQIGIYTETPHSGAVLEVGNLENKGVLMPRMTTLEKEAIMKPAIGLLVYDTDQNCLSQNVGSETAPVWLCLAQNETRFFYMPSINIPTPNIGSAPDLDLYAEYKKQFSTPVGKNANAPANIPYYTSPSDLYYYITYYDKNVLNITNITDDGKMSYTILRKADYDTYMNVVFVVK